MDLFKFVSNRFRSVKQDLFKQQCPASKALPILEPIARYFAWAAYWYSEEKHFESYLHDLLLLEVIKEILRLSERDNFPASDDIEALYILYTLGQSEGLLRALDFLAPRRSSIIHQCQILSLHWYHRQFTPICRKIKNLPPLLAAFVSVKHLETLRKYALGVMSVSHHSLSGTPWDAIHQTHLFINKDDAIDACNFYSIVKNDKGIVFHRSTKLIKDVVYPITKFNFPMNNLGTPAYNTRSKSVGATMLDKEVIPASEVETIIDPMGHSTHINIGDESFTESDGSENVSANTHLGSVIQGIDDMAQNPDNERAFKKQPWIQEKLEDVCLLSLFYNDQAVC